MQVTVIPTPCGKQFTWPRDVKCGDSAGYFFGRWYCSENCKPLGAQLAIRGTYVDHDECGPHWEDALTWNLTLGALLNAAASQAIEQVLTVERTLSEGTMKVLMGPLQPYTDEPIHLLKKTIDKVWAETPQEQKDYLHAQATPENLAKFEKALFGPVPMCGRCGKYLAFCQCTPAQLSKFMSDILAGKDTYTLGSEDDPDREPGDGFCSCGERLDKPHFHGEF